MCVLTAPTCGVFFSLFLSNCRSWLKWRGSIFEVGFTETNNQIRKLKIAKSPHVHRAAGWLRRRVSTCFVSLLISSCNDCWTSLVPCWTSHPGEHLGNWLVLLPGVGLTSILAQWSQSERTCFPEKKITQPLYITKPINIGYLPPAGVLLRVRTEEKGEKEFLSCERRLLHHFRPGRCCLGQFSQRPDVNKWTG